MDHPVTQAALDRSVTASQPILAHFYHTPRGFRYGLPTIARSGPARASRLDAAVRAPNHLPPFVSETGHRTPPAGRAPEPQREQSERARGVRRRGAVRREAETAALS